MTQMLMLPQRRSQLPCKNQDRILRLHGSQELCDSALATWKSREVVCRILARAEVCDVEVLPEVLRAQFFKTAVKPPPWRRSSGVALGRRQLLHESAYIPSSPLCE